MLARLPSDKIHKISNLYLLCQQKRNHLKGEISLPSLGGFFKIQCKAVENFSNNWQEEEQPMDKQVSY
jgi:hypothetical protein